MKWQKIAKIMGLVSLGCFGLMGLPAQAQTPLPGAGLNAELSQAVCQQDWARAIRIVDRMRPLTPEARRGELTVYRSRLQAMLNSGTPIPNWQCGAGGATLSTTPPVTSAPFTPSTATGSNPSNPANITDTTIRGIRPNNSSNSSSETVNRPTSTSGTNAVAGSCETPDQLDANGRRCGARAASERTGGR